MPRPKLFRVIKTILFYHFYDQIKLHYRSHETFVARAFEIILLVEQRGRRADTFDTFVRPQLAAQHHWCLNSKLYQNDQ